MGIPDSGCSIQNLPFRGPAVCVGALWEGASGGLGVEVAPTVRPLTPDAHR